MAAHPDRRLLVDAMNVIGSRPDGWWRDRDGAARRLVDALAQLRAADGDAVTVVLDGRPVPGLAEGDHAGVAVRYARRRGPDAADDRIVELLGDCADPRAWTVVTSDRALRERSEALGAVVVGAGTLLARLP
ncbi:MAG: NYN domain-containing protein [Egibacteraceae bacterium]